VITGCEVLERALYESSGVLIPLRSVVGIRDCDGPMDRAHLIPQRLMCRELAFPYADQAVSNPAGWLWSCRKHHHLLDVAKKVRLTAEVLPPAVIRLADELDELVPGDKHPFRTFIEAEYLCERKTEALA
jgi:hypothetical protein